MTHTHRACVLGKGPCEAPAFLQRHRAALPTRWSRWRESPVFLIAAHLAWSAGSWCRLRCSSLRRFILSPPLGKQRKCEPKFRGGSHATVCGSFSLTKVTAILLSGSARHADVYDPGFPSPSCNICLSPLLSVTHAALDSAALDSCEFTYAFTLL